MSTPHPPDPSAATPPAPSSPDTSSRTSEPVRPRPVLFLHGSGVGGWMWQPQIVALSDRSTLAPDLPGTLSARDTPWWDLDETADWLLTLLADEADGPVDVVGLSFGGVLALHLATRCPEATRSVLVSGASVLPYPPHMRWAVSAQLAVWERGAYWAGMARSLRIPADGREEFLAASPPSDRATMRRIVDQVMPGSATDLDEVTSPVLAVAGERESAYFHRSLRALGTAVPHAELALAPGMHHAWSGEHPELFTAMVRQWCDERRVHQDLLPLPG